ncbi:MULTISPECIES: enoyl-CoA hydratase/isomerase family protein [unclassified Pseudofrankia]|uniref:enoyl-CoA hydratase/isomerase family protein n=1 Tax=unclassified Pseudofrankia TaxID=2994372 RepID=UPI0008D93AD3|nr:MULTISPECIES: enoyl-CoA hydratase/isomerase family protein [unclassified Pseudofrankia]MDT3443329.1 enoyl-CoA hydratase/isomerase family protein [Pseudofrankia sp. BMG5.37]OHV65338.1 enoyl-CoA hydratase [Pseudofrankia sp. BMG5.36]
MIDLDIDGGLAVVTVDRPEARNAISRDTMDELEKVLDAVDTSGAHALAITGGGDRAFISGGDLKELATIRTKEGAVDMALRMRGLCDRIAAFRGPVIAAINGHALGGGAEVAIAADIRVAAEDIRIGFTQAMLAIMPGWGGAERLAAVVGRGRALMLAGSGAVVDTAEAARLGLVDKVLPRAEFDAGWRALAKSLAHHPAAETKRVMSGTVGPREAAEAFGDLWVSDAHWAEVDKVLNRIRDK